jgi:hypothetical protein
MFVWRATLIGERYYELGDKAPELPEDRAKELERLGVIGPTKTVPKTMETADKPQAPEKAVKIPQPGRKPKPPEK